MRRRLVLVVLGVLVVFAVAVVGALWWVGQPGFVVFALDRAVQASAGRLSYAQASGTLLGGLSVERLAWREPQATEGAPAQAAAVVITGLRLDWSALALTRREFDLTRLSARELRIELPADDGAPVAIPQTLALPIGLRVREATVDRLAIERHGEAPVELRDVALAARYRPGEYRIDRLRIGSAFGELALNATVGDAAPYPLLIGAQISADWRAVSASVLASGNVEEIALSAAASAPRADVQSVDAPSTGVPSADARSTDASPADAPGLVFARVTVRPFDREPLGPVELGVRDLDPGTLGLAGAPRMRLNGTAQATVLLPREDRALRVTGEASVANTLAGSVATGRLPVSAVATRLDWHEGVLELGRVQADLMGGGSIEGTATIDTTRSVLLYGTTVPSLRADLALRDVDLSRFSAALGRTRLAGRARSDGGRLELELSDRVRGGAAIGALLRVDDRNLAIERAELRKIPGLGEAKVALTGRIGLAEPYVASLKGDFSGVDPSRLPEVLAQLGGTGAGRPAGKGQAQDAAPAGASPDWLATLAGSVDGHWALDGPLAPGDPRPRQIEFDLTDGTLAGLRARASARAALEPGRVQGVRADVALGDARAQVNGALGAPADALSVSLRVGSLAQVAKLLEARGAQVAMTGALRAQGTLRGSLLAPAVSLKASGSDLALPGELAASRVDLDIVIPGWDADAPLQLQARATDVALGARPIRLASLTASGPLGAHVFRGEIRSARASARFSGRGALADQRWRATLDEFTTDGTLPLRLDGSLSVQVAADAVELGPARLVANFGTVAIRQASWREGRFALSAQAAIERLRPLVEMLGAAPTDRQDRRALDEIGLDVTLDLAGSAPAEVSGTASASLRAAQGAAGAPASGRADLTLSQGRLSGPLELDLPSLAFTERIVGPEWVFDGRLRFSGEVAGTIAKPRLKGALRGEGLRLEQRALGWRLGEGTLAARFDGETFEVESLRLVSLAKGGGSVEMKGQVRAEGLEGRFDFAAQRLVVPIGPGQRVVMSGDASIASTRGRFEIRGKLKADEGLIELVGGDAPKLPEDVTIRGAEDKVGKDDAATVAKRLRIDSDLELDLGERLRIRGSGVDALLTGVIALRGSLPGAPRAFGTVRVRDGRYTAYGQKLVITRGRVVFNGPLDNPVLDIVALRREQAVEAGVAVTGTVLDPRIRLTSIPEVPDAEKLSWLVLGTSLEGAQSSEQSAALQAAAVSLFGSSEGGVAAELKQTLGLDVFTVRSSGGGGSLMPGGFGEATPVPGQLGSFSKSRTGTTATDSVFVIGKRLSKQVMVTYEQGLSGATSLVSIQYDFARRFSLRAQSGSEADGQSAVDLIFRYPFD